MVQVNDAEKTAKVVVTDDMLSLAIGREGQNARLAARLTGWKIDVKPYSSLVKSDVEDIPEEDEPAAPADDSLFDEDLGDLE